MKAKSPPKELYFEGVTILTNATKYIPSIPHMASSSFHMWNFAQCPPSKNPLYLDSPELINFYVSSDLDASLPQIERYRTRLKTLVGNFGEPSTLAFHNLIQGPSIELQTRFVGETLYCITGQPNRSTKNLNICISICPTNVSRPSFKQPRT